MLIILTVENYDNLGDCVTLPIVKSSTITGNTSSGNIEYFINISKYYEKREIRELHGGEVGVKAGLQDVSRGRKDY